MKKLIIIILAVFAILRLQAQTKPTIVQDVKLNNGKTLTIYSNGTWKEKVIKTWKKIIDGSADESKYIIIKTSDGMFAIAGYKSGNCWMTKIDKNGNILWEKSYEGGYHLKSFIQTSDGGYIAATDESSIIKIDKNGNREWKKTFNENIALSSIVQTIEGGYLLAGVYTTKPDYKTSYSFYFKSYIMKLDKDGNQLLDKSYRSDEYSTTFLNSLIKTADGGYAFIGYSTPKANKVVYAMVVKLDKDANLIWEKHYECYGGNVYDIIQTVDGGYLIAFDESVNSRHVLQLDKDGNKSWKKNFIAKKEQFLGVLKIFQTKDGGFILASDGEIQYNVNNVDKSGWLTKLSKNGDLVWEQTYQLGKYGNLSCVIQTSDNYYIATGESNKSIVIIKVDQNGTLD